MVDEGTRSALSDGRGPLGACNVECTGESSNVNGASILAEGDMKPPPSPGETNLENVMPPSPLEPSAYRLAGGPSPSASNTETTSLEPPSVSLEDAEAHSSEGFGPRGWKGG